MTDEEQKNIFSKNLNRYIEKFNKTQIQIAKDLHINPQTINSWCRGKALPRMGKLQSLADYFGIEKSDLIEERSPTWSGNFKPPAPPKRKGVRIPVLGYVAAGVPIDAIEEIIDWEEIPKEMAARGEYFGLRIKGDSMAPDIKNKDVVIVRKQPDAENDEIVIVTINGDEGVCKKLRKAPEGITLISRNPAYDPMFFTPQEVDDLPVTIVGKVIELRRSF